MRGRPSQDSTDLPLLCDKRRPYALSDLNGPAALDLFSLGKKDTKKENLHMDRLKDTQSWRSAMHRTFAAESKVALQSGTIF